nr:MAG TPA: hypothetical protein [Caudoviricetes sp.]
MVRRDECAGGAQEIRVQKNPQRGGLLEVNYLQALYSIIRSIQDIFMQSQH